VAARDGLLLIDEFDASLHPGAQLPIIEFLMRAAQKNNVQVCISTHSIETVDAFLEAYDELSGLFKGPEGLRVFQLRDAKGQTEVKSLDADTARRLREEMGHDLRLRA
jgi:AAA15 family ATPase/GTPase